ncbi:Outer membrane vitamin B12 receptor BtuB [hydrothermal vent metagenome]|uniref:Outer membrane vitamin B12 receptor BtuB n=1 Tax=hydrothermal vent metagenome TaxID=652676 RepID=A0A3B1CQC9_9ZZZZ
MQRLFLLVLSFICLSLVFLEITPLHAADDSVDLKPVSVTRTRMSDTPSPVTVITEKDFKEKQYTKVQDLLRAELGIEVVQSGPLGTATSVFMRGAGSSSTLVLVDGIQVNSNTLGSFNFADISVDNIERIEILRGSQSTLWGSDAVGGVINIITKRGKGKPTHSISFEGGSFGTFKESINSSGDLGFMDYSVSVSRTDSAGFSAANKNRGNTENDGYENTTVSTRLGRNFLDDGRVDFIGRFTKAINEFDSFGFVDGKPFSKSDAYYLALPIQKTMMDRWDLKINPTLAYEFLRTLDPGGFTKKSHILNRTHGVDVQNIVEINKYFSTTFGYEYESRNGVNEESNLRDTIINNGFYVETQCQCGENLLLTAGFRHDINSVFEDPTTYKFSGAYRIHKTGTRIRGAYATGFRAPTLNELFFPNFGTATLKPEESKSWEVGLDQNLMDDKVIITVTYFETDFENLIETVDLGGFVFRAQNVAKATIKGVETSINIDLPQNFRVSTNYTWLKARDDDGEPLQRRAEHNFSVNLNHTWREKLNTLVGVRVRSDTRSNSTGTRITSAFTTVRAALSYQVNKNLKLTARGENLFDENYEENFGFGTAGVSGYGGFTWTFN